MSPVTLQEKINLRKGLFLQTLKEKGVFIEFCPKRGYIYEVVQLIIDCISRVIVALKNGVLQVLAIEPTENLVA